MLRSQKKGPAAVSSAAEPWAMSPVATVWLLPPVIPVPMHHATHAADRVPASVDDAVMDAGDSHGRSRTERGCRSRRRESGGAERGEQGRGDHRSAQGMSPLVPPPGTVASHGAAQGADPSTVKLGSSTLVGWFQGRCHETVGLDCAPYKRRSRIVRADLPSMASRRRGTGAQHLPADAVAKLAVALSLTSNAKLRRSESPTWRLGRPRVRRSSDLANSHEAGADQ